MVAQAGLVAAKVYGCKEATASVNFDTNEIGEYSEHGRATIIDYGNVFAVVKEDFELVMVSGVLEKKPNKFGVRRSTNKEGAIMSKGTGQTFGIFSAIDKEVAVVWSCLE